MTTQDSDWFGPDSATFGDRVAGAREQAQMTQAQLARRLGVKKATLVAWEQDMSEPRANKLSMLAGLLNVSIMWLLTGEGDGMSAPVLDLSDVPDFSEIVAELREVRATMRANIERTARLEKKLRLLIPKAAE